MSGNLYTLQRRVVKLEGRLANLSEKKKLANCICLERFCVLNPEEFEREMNRPCRVHGFRSLGQVRRIVFIKPDKTEIENPKVDKLLKVYKARQKTPKSSRELR